MEYFIAFATGLFCCNCIPHLASGLRGESFPTPFAKPRGIGLSSALVNFLWGFANLLAALVLLHYHPLSLEPTPQAAAWLAGFLLLGIYTACHFANVRNA